MSFSLIDPDEKRDFSIDFSSLLDAGVAVEASSPAPAWSIFPTGPTLSDESLAGDVATVVFDGGTRGVIYTLTCEVASDASPAETIVRSLSIRCGDR